MSVMSYDLSQPFAHQILVPLIHRCQAAYSAQLKRVWHRLPAAARDSAAGRAYGRHLNALVRRSADREQSIATLFLRNRAELALMVRLLRQTERAARVDIAVIGCSKGAEVYSILWAIRTARPDLRPSIVGVDISQGALALAEQGRYSLARAGAEATANWSNTPDGRCRGIDTQTDQTAWMFERVSTDELQAMFETVDGYAVVRPWLRQGVTWRQGDAGDPHLADVLGQHDIVVANRFLCHMAPDTAERCLLNVAQLVRPGGYLFVSGIDLDLRSEVARRMGWMPVVDLLREVHDGDDTLLRGWPTEYWGLEPFDATRPDRTFRYASVFQIGQARPPAAQAQADSAGEAHR